MRKRNKWKRLRAGSLPLTKRGRIARKMEKFIRRNNLYISHFIKENGKNIERIDYYPRIEYREEDNNMFCIRIRMDGSRQAEKFREYEQALADLFFTICINKIEERGYLTYCFELKEQEQAIIQSNDDIQNTEKNEIVFSQDIIWNWNKCPHFLLTGNTGSGKTQLAQYIIVCLIKKGVRVIYCDPKNDDDIRLFMQTHPSVKYCTKENHIAKIVRETEEEIRTRERDLQSIGIKEAEFNPVFLLFDEMIAFSKIAEKKTYDEIVRRLGTIVVTGRSKCIYTGIITQRADTAFIEGAIRDNLGCRIAMGQMTDTAYKMAFGSEFSKVKNHRHEIGSGLIYRQGVDTVPREFLAPYICKGALNKE